MRGLFEQVEDAVQSIRQRWTETPRVGLILGTGLGDLADQIEQRCDIPYEDIAHFPRSTVESHAGQLVCGQLQGVPVVAMQGRFHYYEGWTMPQVTFPVRVFRALGAEILLANSAVGAMNPHYRLADTVIVDDHISLMPDNPLRGINDDRLGPRFPDMSRPYDAELSDLAAGAALELGIAAHRGVLVAVPGPNLETRAEYRMLRNIGADVVGMSTVPEVIVATHCGLRVLAFSVVTDICLPDALEPVDIEQILATAATGGERLARLIPEVLSRLG